MSFHDIIEILGAAASIATVLAAFAGWRKTRRPAPPNPPSHEEMRRGLPRRRKRR